MQTVVAKASAVRTGESSAVREAVATASNRSPFLLQARRIDAWPHTISVLTSNSDVIKSALSTKKGVKGQTWCDLQWHRDLDTQSWRAAAVETFKVAQVSDLCEAGVR